MALTDDEQRDLESLLGEGFHTAFRKVADCEQAMPIWRLIKEMPPTEWESVLVFVIECLNNYYEITSKAVA